MRYPRCTKNPSRWNHIGPKIVKRAKLTSPWEIEAIVNRILDFVDMQDLLSCRLVCRLWTNLASSKLRRLDRLVQVNIMCSYETSDEIKHSIQDMVQLRESSLKSNLKDYFPYEKFEIRRVPLNFGSVHIIRFFELFSGMTHLKISQETMRYADISAFREMLIFHLRQLVHLELDFPTYRYSDVEWLFPPKVWKLASPIKPNIKILSLTFVDSNCSLSPQFVVDLFRAVPNVETLKLRGLQETKIQTFLEGVMDIGKYPLKKLINLHVFYDQGQENQINQIHLDRLAELGEQYLKLKSLILPSIPNNIQLLPNQQKFFEVFSSTLEKVVIAKFSTFHALDTVKSSKLKYFKCDEVMGVCSLDFIQNLTELETLSIGRVNSGDSIELKDLAFSETDSKPHSLRHLALPVGLRDHLALPNILDGFASLCRLELTADNNSLQVIYQSVSQLQEIILFSDSVITDEGITGIPFGICRRLHQNQCKLDGETNPEKWRQAPWIGNLKNLRLFQIVETNEDFPPKNKISNVSVVFGFKFVKDLTNLAIPKTLITDFSLDYIGKYYNLIYLDVSYCFWLTPSGLEGLKENTPNLQITVKNWYTNLVPKYRKNKHVCIPSEYHFMQFD